MPTAPDSGTAAPAPARGPLPLWVDITLDLVLLACLIALAVIDAPDWITLPVFLLGLALGRTIRRAVRARCARRAEDTPTSDRPRLDPCDGG